MTGDAVSTQSPASIPESPSIVALQQAVSQGNRSAEPEFWDRVQKTGSPLIEQTQGAGDKILITFLWKGDSETRNVVLVNTAIASSDLAESQLIRIPESNVWYRSYFTRPDVRFTYELSVNDDMTPFDQVTDWGKRTATFHVDPLNVRVFRSTIMGGRELSYFEGPSAPSERWIAPQSGVAKGRLEKTSFESHSLGNRRDMWVYTPSGFDVEKHAGEGLPLLMVFDGGEYVSSIPTPTILDNLMAAKRIPPVIAIFLGNPDGERDNELNANLKFEEFVATELVPWARKQFPLTTSPRKNVVIGSSSGGLAAASLAFRYPNLFGNVLSQSGAYFFAPERDEEPELLPRIFATEPRRDIHFYLEVGTLESNRESFKGVNMLSSNRHFRDVLLAKGYPVMYQEFAGGHSDLNWRAGVADGLIALIGR